jgi:hypothetical protein
MFSMAQFAIIEVEDGLTVAEVKPGEKPEDAATREGGLLIDPGPYATYEEATDAMIELQAEEDDERE